MLKKRLISLISAISIVMSFAITANAEILVAESSINPTFSVIENPELVDEQYEYWIGITYDGDDFEMVKSKGKWNGTGLRNLSFNLDFSDVDVDWAEAVAGQYVESKGTYVLNISDYGFYALKSGDPLIKVYTNEKTDLSKFKCTLLNLTVGSVEANVITYTTAYSSSQAIVDKGTANFLAYLEKQAEPTKYTITATDAKVSAAEAEEGTEITVTPTQKNDYEITAVKYNGTAITPVEGVYKFTMPAANVTQ